jgi:hypothetical protein
MVFGNTAPGDVEGDNRLRDRESQEEMCCN